jgi:hypothetical protein
MRNKKIRQGHTRWVLYVHMDLKVKRTDPDGSEAVHREADEGIRISIRPLRVIDATPYSVLAFHPSGEHSRRVAMAIGSYLQQYATYRKAWRAGQVALKHKTWTAYLLSPDRQTLKVGL